MNRPTTEALEAMYTQACKQPSDINEHLPMLREYASKCEHVTEMGMRTATGSTVALLAAQPLSLISWDLNPFSVVQQQVLDLLSINGPSRTRFQPRCGDTLEINIEETEMLFIDTLHTAKQLLAELMRHGGQVTKYIALHDTISFGEKGEDGTEPGLRAAVRKWQYEEVFPLWKVVQDCENNNGLVILQHVRVDD